MTPFAAPVLGGSQPSLDAAEVGRRLTSATGRRARRSVVEQEPHAGIGVRAGACHNRAANGHVPSQGLH
jgi:hypothetical protein